jgi:hypothetical protein
MLNNVSTSLPLCVDLLEAAEYPWKWVNPQAQGALAAVQDEAAVPAAANNAVNPWLLRNMPILKMLFLTTSP